MTRNRDGRKLPETNEEWVRESEREREIWSTIMSSNKFSFSQNENVVHIIDYHALVISAIYPQIHTSPSRTDEPRCTAHMWNFDWNRSRYSENGFMEKSWSLEFSTFRVCVVLMVLYSFILIPFNWVVYSCGLRRRPKDRVLIAAVWLCDKRHYLYGSSLYSLPLYVRR